MLKSGKEESNLRNWLCVSCKTINTDSDKNEMPCTKCHILNSETNLYRASCLYLLGNIKHPDPELLPLKTPFFIYPLSAPMVTITKDVKDDGVWIHFEIDYLYDIKHFEMYHIEQAKFKMYKLSTIHKQKHSDFIIHNLTPYYNIFSKFIPRPWCGEFSVDIYVKCYGSNRISPKQTLKFDLLPPKNSIPQTNKRYLHEIVTDTNDSRSSKRPRIDSNTNKNEEIFNKNTNSSNTNKIKIFNNVEYDEEEALRIALAMSAEHNKNENKEREKRMKKQEESDLKQSLQLQHFFLSGLQKKHNDLEFKCNKFKIETNKLNEKCKALENAVKKYENVNKKIERGAGGVIINKIVTDRNDSQSSKRQPFDNVNKNEQILNKNTNNNNNKIKIFDDGKYDEQEEEALRKALAISAEHNKNENKEREKRKKKQEESDLKQALQLQHFFLSGGVIINKVMVVLLCVEQYFGNKKYKYKAKDLSGVKNDKMKMIELFSNKYNYDVIYNKGKYCTLEQVQKLGKLAKTSFDKGDYQCIMVIFSGHGSLDTLILSDYQQITKFTHNRDFVYKYNKINRVDLETYFDGNSIPNKAKAIKLYFVDACRSGGSVALNDTIDITNDKSQSNMKIHPNTNSCIFYPNTEPYTTYSSVGRGGILINSLYETMVDNINKDNNFSDLQDLISKKAEKYVVRVKDDNGKYVKVKLKVECKTTMKNKDCTKIKFKKNPISKDKRKGYFHQQQKTNHTNILFV